MFSDERGGRPALLAQADASVKSLKKLPKIGVESIILLKGDKEKHVFRKVNAYGW